MGWSIKKPFGKKKSIFNQIARFTGVGTIATVAASSIAQTAKWVGVKGLDKTAQQIGANAGFIKNANSINKVGQVGRDVGLVVAGGALVNSMSAPSTVTRFNIVTGQPYQQVVAKSALSPIWTGAKAVATTVAKVAQWGAGLLPFIPHASPQAPAQQNPTADTLPWVASLPGYQDMQENLPASLETSAGDGGSGGGSLMTAGGGAVLPIVLLAIVGFVLTRKGGVPTI